MPDGAALAADVASRGQYLFTVEEFRGMPFDEDARIELIEGIIVPMSPMGAQHFWVVDRLDRLLRAALEPRLRVRPECAIQLGERSQVQPDISVYRTDAPADRLQLPGTRNLLLLVEVADSTLARDRRDKVPLYALHGIAELWLINIAEQTAEIFRDPAEGAYRDVQPIGPDGTLTTLVAPRLSVPMRALFEG